MVHGATLRIVVDLYLIHRLVNYSRLQDQHLQMCFNMLFGHFINVGMRQVEINKGMASLNLAIIDLIVWDLLLLDKGRREEV